MAEFVIEYKDEGLYTTRAKERVVRCRDCVYCEEGSTGLLECRKLLFAGEYEGDEPIPLGPFPNGFCAWGEERKQ